MAKLQPEMILSILPKNSINQRIEHITIMYHITDLNKRTTDLHDPDLEDEIAITS